MRLIACFAFSVLLAACQSAAPAGPSPVGSAAGNASAAGPPAGTGVHSPEVQRLIAAAQGAGEHELNLSWSDNTLGGSAGVGRWQTLFNRLYGLDVRISFTPGPSMTDMAGRISQEVVAGRKASTDVLLGGEAHVGSLIDLDVLERYDYSALTPRVTADMLAPLDMAVEFTSRLPGITYNSNIVPPADVPRLLEDTLHPRWKGRIASTLNAASFDRVASRPEWGAERMTAFVTRLSENISGLMRCGEATRIMSGEFLMLVMDCGSYEARRQSANGAPLAHVIPEDAATVLFFYLGIPRTSAHPNLAKLYTNMVLSEEGQRTLFDIEATDHYALPGSQSAAELSGLRAKGLEPLRFDARYVVEHPDSMKLGDDLAKILREKR